MNHKSFDKGIELVTSIMNLVANKAEAQRVNLHGDDWTHVMRTILSIAGLFLEAL